MLDVGHHGDGESLPSEALPQLDPRTCPHARCEGLMLPDADDPTHRKCSECGRSTFTPPQAVLEEEPSSLQAEYVIFRGMFPPRARGKAVKRDGGIRQASFNAISGRFR